MTEFLQTTHGGRTFTERYLDGLLVPAPIELDQTPSDHRTVWFKEPAESQRFLRSIGFEGEYWTQLLDRRTVSHEVRASIVIARSAESRSLKVLMSNIRLLDELDGVISTGNAALSRNNAAWRTPAAEARLAQETIK